MCSSKCGRGTRRKYRTKETVEENGGQCYGEPSGIDVCQDCSGIKFQNLNLLSLIVKKIKLNWNNQLNISVIFIGCSDRYPRKMTASCRKSYACSKLKTKCSWTYRRLLSSKCEKKISNADLNKKVNHYCTRSCQTKCPGK